MDNVFINGNDITDYITSFEEYNEMEEDKLIGNAVSTQIKIKLKNKDNQLKELIDYPFVIGDKTYIVYEKPEKWTNIISVTLYDKMILTNIAFKTELTYPVTLSEQIDEMESICGAQIDKTTLSEDLLSKEVNWYDSTMIIRNYLGFIAECDGKNAMIENDQIVFRPLAEVTHETDFCSNYELNEFIPFSRVCFEDGVTTPLECGDDTGKTLYLSSNNLYVEQSDIERIYSMYNGLSFYSFKKFNCKYIEGIKLTHLVNYHEITILPISIKRKVYGGEAKDSLEMKCDITLKNAESIVVKDDPMIRIKRVQATIDQANQKVNIIAEHQESTDKKISEFELGLDGVKSSVESTTTEVKTIKNALGIEYQIESSLGYFFESESDEDSILTARIFKDGEEIDPDGNLNYTWYCRHDGASDEDILGTGKTINLSMSHFVDNALIYFTAESEETYYLTDELGYILTDESGNALIL